MLIRNVDTYRGSDGFTRSVRDFRNVKIGEPFVSCGSVFIKIATQKIAGLRVNSIILSSGQKDYYSPRERVYSGKGIEVKPL